VIKRNRCFRCKKIIHLGRMLCLKCSKEFDKEMEKLGMGVKNDE